MKIKFSHQFDKLTPEKFKKNEIFTTFRAYDVRKDIYYEKNINKEFEVILNDKKIGNAILLSKTYRWSYDLTDDEIKNDTFSKWNKNDFYDLMKKFYGCEKVYGLWLRFKITDVMVE